MTALLCARCETSPTPDQVRYRCAIAGGTHYRELHHGAGIPGTRGEKKLRSCGPWIAASASPAERAAAYRTWSEQRELLERGAL